MVMRRLLSAMCVALLLSGGCTLLLAKKLAKPHQTSSYVRYIAASRDIDAGEILKAGDVAEVNWPASTPVSGAVMSSGDALGRAVLSPMGKGQPLVTKLLSAVGGLGLSAKVPNGMRAISLRSDQIVGVAGFLLPGTHIDVLVTYRALGTADSVTATVLQDAEILATGQKTQPDPDGKPTTTDVVTLLVSSLDAERLVLASSQGTLHFVLRNGADRQLDLPRPVDVATLGLKAPSPIHEVKPLRPALPKQRAESAVSQPVPAQYSVIVMRGDKQTVETF